MKLKEHKGFKRLAILIALISSVVSYIALVNIYWRASEEEVFIVFPIIAILISLGSYILVRITYWVIDGFRIDSNKTTDDD